MSPTGSDLPVQPAAEPPDRGGDVPARDTEIAAFRRDLDAAEAELATVRRRASARRERYAEQLEAADARAVESERKLLNARSDLDRMRRRRIYRLGRTVEGAVRRITGMARDRRGSRRALERSSAAPSSAERMPTPAVYTGRGGSAKASSGHGGAPAVAIHIAAKTTVAAEKWGDTAFANSLKQEFTRRGWSATVHVADEWDTTPAVRADLALHLFGGRAPAVRPGQPSVLWVISHPDRVTARLLAPYDVVFVASESFGDQLADVAPVPVVPLLQATDPDRFHPDPGGPQHELLFVGNSRGVRRPILDALATSPRDLAVYGGGWTPKLLDPSRLRGEWIPNDELNRYYSSAAIVLNDHWRDMREEGFISNRVFDVLASGGFVVSDPVLGLDEAVDGAVVAWTDGDDLGALVEHYLARPDERRSRAEKGRAAVLARHTFAHRVDTIIGAVSPLLAAMPMAQTGDGV